MKNGHGGSRNAGKKVNRMPSPNAVIERAAGDWIPIAKGEPEGNMPEIFYSFNDLDDGYLIEEILSPEDIYPAMYRRVVNS
jgi:hypothetical protein